MNKYHQDTPTATTAAPDRTANNLHTVSAGVKVPLAQTVITGALFGALVLILALVLRWRLPLAWGGITALGVMILSWLYSMRHWINLTSMELWTGVDLNGDGNVGEPPPVVRIDLTTQSGAARRTQRLEIPATPEQLHALAVGIERGLPFSQRQWAGKGKPFSDTQFRDLRAYLLRSELLAPASEKSGTVGYQLTDNGRAVINAYLTPDGVSE